MNQRSYSFKIKPKTHLHTDHSFECHSSNKHLLNIFKNKHQYRPPRKPQPQPSKKTVTLCQSTIHGYLLQSHIHQDNCINHLHKKGVFQSTQRIHQIYCHECAIKAVKDNIKVISITPHTLFAQCMLTQQLQKLNQEELKVKETIEQHYRQARQQFERMYADYLSQQTQAVEKVIFGEFIEGSEVLNRVKHCLGKIEQMEFKFVADKENQWRNIKSRDSVDKPLKDFSIDSLLETTRSLQSQANGDKKSVRPRQNSEFAVRKKGLESKRIMIVR